MSPNKSRSKLTHEEIRRIAEASREWADRIGEANLPAEQMCLRALDEDEGPWKTEDAVLEPSRHKDTLWLDGISPDGIKALFDTYPQLRAIAEIKPFETSVTAHHEIGLLTLSFSLIPSIIDIVSEIINIATSRTAPPTIAVVRIHQDCNEERQPVYDPIAKQLKRSTFLTEHGVVSEEESSD